MERAREEIIDVGVLNNASGVHDADDVGILGDDAEVVGDEHDGHAGVAFELAEQREDLLLDGGVERRGGLVGQQKHGLAGKGHGDHDALTHAAGELVRECVDALFGIGDADGAEGVKGDLLCCSVIHGLVQQDRLDDLIADGEDGIERGHRLLKDHGDLCAANGADVALGHREEVAPRFVILNPRVHALVAADVRSHRPPPHCGGTE